MTERPGTWQRVRTESGWHLRLIGANGEPVLTSEVYTDPRTVTNALILIYRTAGADLDTELAPPDRLTAWANDHALVDVDERGTGPVT